jgi:ELWxxDGT repeat protein
VTDGGNGHAHMVSIVQDNNEGNPKELTAYQGQLYFVGNDGATGNELWRTNGTPAGTTMVANINPGAGDAHVQALTVSGSKLYFVADDGTHGFELWMHDGSSVTQLKDIMPNSESSHPKELTDVDGKLYFSALDHSHGRELWVSNGTPSGTMLYHDVVSGAESSHPRELTAVGKEIVYVAMDKIRGRNIFRNTQNETFLDTLYSTTLPPRNLFGCEASYGFVEGWAEYGLEPYWSKNPTLNRLADIAEGTASSNPKWLGCSATGDHLYFSADDTMHGRELWMSDGTELGTYQIQDIANHGSSSMLNLGAKIGNIHYFVYRGQGGKRDQLYRSDGTPSGTYPLKSLDRFRWMTVFKDRLYFADERYIYSTDGTAKHTHLYSPSTQLLSVPYASKPVVFHDKLYFFGREQTQGEQLYCIDGANSLDRVSHFPTSGSHFSNLTVMGDRLYFAASDGATHGIELWKSNGTLGGISLVKDIVNGSGSSTPKALTVFRGKLYFTANTALDGRELWVSDGSESGTKMLSDINAQVGFSSDPKHLTVSETYLYFTAYEPQRGRELWRTDGTSGHVLPVMDIYPGNKNSSPNNLFAWEGHLIFDADDGANGRRVWIRPSDTEDPWMMSTPLNAKGSFAFLPWKVVAVLDHKLFYQLSQDDGTELWVTDGTKSGTKMVWKEQW